MAVEVCPEVSVRLKQGSARSLKNEHGCWIWQGGIASNGYGMVLYEGKIITAHRAAWRMRYGDIPPGSMVLHRCDVRRCVNPDHLFLGTNRENVLDSVTKGRHGRAKPLPIEVVRSVRAMLLTGLSQAAVSRLTHVPYGTVHYIKQGKRYADSI